MIIKELMALREAKAKGVPGKAAKPDFLKNDNSPMGQLERLPQPIGINGGSYTYWVDVTKTPLKFVASDGSEIDEAKTLKDISKWMDKWAAQLWNEFLDGDEDLENLRAENIVRVKKGRGDQADHERMMRESVDINDMAALEAELIDRVMPKLKRFIESGDDIEQFVDGGSDNDYLYDVWGELVKGDAWTDQHAKLEKKLGKMTVKAWREAFKKKYGTTDKEMLLKSEAEGQAKLSADELKLMKHFGEYTTERFGMRDLDPKNEYHLRLYMKSPTKIAITSPTVNGMVFTDETLKKFNMSIEKIVALFARHGIKLGKRPVNKRRPSYSYYD
jgi:hypothetical protein